MRFIPGCIARGCSWIDRRYFCLFVGRFFSIGDGSRDLSALNKKKPEGMVPSASYDFVNGSMLIGLINVGM